MPAWVEAHTLLGLSVALGIGLGVGAERERRKGEGPMRAAAGIRTFTVTALLGAVGQMLGGAVLAAVALGIGALAVTSYLRTRDLDPGLTTEVALLLTCALGALAMPQPALAAAVGVVLAGLLAARERLHRFVRRVLTERELHDAILLLSAALIVLPLAPDRYLGPFDAINPHAVARLVVLVMATGALGYAAVRALGVQRGLPLAGLAGGFVSSTATIHAMGQRARTHPLQAGPAAAGALLSSVATIVLMAFMVALVQPALLRVLAGPLAAGAVATVGYALLAIWRDRTARESPDPQLPGRAFDWRAALGFGLAMAVVLLLSAALHAWLGAPGTLIAAALTGLVDAHATAASMAALVSADKMTTDAALTPVLVGLSTNAITKSIVAWQSGGATFAARIVPGQALMLAAVWGGAVVQSRLV